MEYRKLKQFIEYGDKRIKDLDKLISGAYSDLGCITEKITPTKELYISGGGLAFGLDAKGALYAETYE